MSATIDDKLTQVKPNTTTNAPVTTVSTTRAIGGASLACVDLTDWPTTTAIHFQTYKKKADGTKDFTTAVDMKGIVSSNTIGSVTITNGTDAGNAVGDYVELNPTAAYGEGVYEWGTTEHNVDGTHASITTDSIKEQTASGFALKDSSGNEYLKVAKTASAVNEVTVTNAATGNAPSVSATGGDTNIGLSLSGKASGLLRLSNLIPNKQISTTTYVGNLVIQTGWDRSQGTSTSRVDKTITFPVTFDTILGVIVTHNGTKSTDPATITGSTSAGTEIITTSAVTTSQFVVSIAEKDAGSLGTGYFAYSWIAIGIKA